jgi:hypothetical protein
MLDLHFNMDLMRFLAKHRHVFLTDFFLVATFLGDVKGYILIVTLIYVAFDKTLGGPSVRHSPARDVLQPYSEDNHQEPASFHSRGHLPSRMVRLSTNRLRGLAENGGPPSALVHTIA